MSETLPDPNEPLQTEDGTLPPLSSVSSNRFGRNYEEIPSNIQTQRQVARVQRTIKEIPIDPQQLNAVSLICAYTLIGLSDSDMAVATGLTEKQIGILKMSEGFSYVYDAAIESIISTDADDIRQMVVGHARESVRTIANLRDGSEFDQVRLAASKDLLDRAGHRPADVIEHRHSLDGDLRINIIENTSIGDTIIDLEPVDEEL